MAGEFELEINPQQQIRQVLGLVRRGWFALVTFLALGILVGIALFNFLPKDYESSTSLLLRGNYLLAGVDPREKGGGIKAELLSDQMRSTTWIEEALDRLEWEEWATAKNSKDTTARRFFVERMKARVRVDVARGPTGERVVRILFRYPDKWKARDFVAALRDVWSAKVQQNFQEMVDSEVEVRMQELDSKQAELDRAWREMEAFENRHGVSMLRYRQDYLQRSMDTRAALDQVEADIAGLQARQDEYEAMLLETDEEGSLKIPPEIAQARLTQDPVFQQQIGAVEQLSRSLLDMKQRGYTDKHPQVIATQEQLTLAITALSLGPQGSTSEEVMVPNPVYETMQQDLRQLRQELKGLQGKQEKLQADLATVMEVLDTQPAVERELEQRRREIDTFQQLVTADVIALQPALDRQNSLRLNRGGVVSYVSLEEPTVAPRPVATLGWIALGISVIVGAGIGVTILMARELFKSSFATAAQARRALKLPILGEVAPIQTELEARRARLQRNLQMAASVTLLVGIAATIYLCMNHSDLLPAWLLEKATALREGLL